MVVRIYKGKIVLPRVLILLLALTCRLLAPVSHTHGAAETSAAHGPVLETAASPETSSACWAPRASEARLLLRVEDRQLPVFGPTSLFAGRQRGVQIAAAAQKTRVVHRQIYPPRRWLHGERSRSRSDADPA